MKCLLPYLLREECIDEIRFWINTGDRDDIGWIRQMVMVYKKCTMEDRGFKPSPPPGRDSCKFFDKCIESDTVYVKIDDELFGCKKTASKIWLSSELIILNILLFTRISLIMLFVIS